MKQMELLDKIGKLIKYKDGKGYIRWVDIMNLNLDIATYCHVIEVLNRNDITITKNKVINDDEILNKVLMCQKSGSLELQNEIMEELMYNIFLYVSYFAKCYHIPVQELISYGCEAVILAIQDFKPSFYFPFVRYCNKKIKLYLQKAVGDITDIKIDDRDNVLDEFYDFIIKHSALVGGTFYITEEVRSELASNIANRYVSLDSDEFYDYDSVNSNDECIKSVDDKYFISDMLDILSFKERRLLELRYGLNGNLDYTCSELGKMGNVSKEWVNFKERKILKRIKKLNNNF